MAKPQAKPAHSKYRRFLKTVTFASIPTTVADFPQRELGFPAQELFQASFPADDLDRLIQDRLILDATYAMKQPFFDYEVARQFLDQAEKNRAGDWRVWTNRASISLLEGRLAVGRNELERAVDLSGGALDAEDRKAHPYLKEALSKSGLEYPGKSP